MKLSEILEQISPLSVTGDGGAIEIGSLTSDSRKCTAGTLFVAVRGFSSDGNDYIPAAIAAGASAIITEDPSRVPEGFPCAAVASARKALALAADAFYRHPSRRLRLVGITGTNGKTTTVTLLYNMFRSMGYCCGLLSTIANYVDGKKYETENTTSDPVTINALLAQMADCGCEFCFMEVSSVGLEQDRVAGLTFAGGIFSNLTHDHLDYHKTFAEYLRCKKLFFDGLPREAFALTNIDDRNGLVMTQNCRARVYTYSCRDMADFRADIIEETFDGMLLEINGKEVWSRLIGQHNAYNLLAIYATAVLLGCNQEETLTALSALSPAPGRLECIRGPRGITAVIDYAHTPDALENVLATLRETGKDKFIMTLFGCGGDRDRSKRPEMAAAAEKYSDRIFVTSDNPRTEEPEKIIADIKAGFSPEGLRKAIFITSREEAIRTALLTAMPGSVILLAGKGHEDYQVIGKEKRHFDEKEIVRAVFDEIG